MAEVVVYTLLTATVIIVLFFLTHKQNEAQSVEALITRRLGRRLEMPVFDPLVTRIERLFHEKETNTVQNVKEEKDDMFDEYFAQERRLNTTMRIKFLFPLLDAAPRDGFVSLKELQTWMMQQTEDNMGYRTANELELQNKDKDGVITFEEYLPQISRKDIELKNWEIFDKMCNFLWRSGLSSPKITENPVLFSPLGNTFCPMPANASPCDYFLYSTRSMLQLPLSFWRYFGEEDSKT